MAERRRYSCVVVGTDGSALAGPTVSRAAWLAVGESADLVIVCAWSDLPRRADAVQRASLGADPAMGQVRGREAASAAIAEAVSVAQQAGATIRAALLADGEPGTALMQTVQQYDADVLVVGAVFDRSVADRLLGTVAEQVVKKAPCDVLIVRPAGSTGSELPVPQS